MCGHFNLKSLRITSTMCSPRLPREQLNDYGKKSAGQHLPDSLIAASSPPRRMPLHSWGQKC